ncbi:hypothetical protein B0H16DRAFT_433383 [Mycena metata]|uniref:Uncharacterized protein n=1 Tax=Mycena metata TaxID=1033252 RepID=A0AAD7MHR3_9AGAR|nr:hypothetical protein B0H16DRAFT_433383 [Mycena metata]
MMMDLDDLDMHTMRDNLPENDESDCDSVQWKSSQTTNRALDSLLLEAQQNAIKASTPREDGWTWGSPKASNSRTTSAPTLFFQPTASSAVVAAPTTSRRRSRGTQNGRAQSLSVSMNMGLGLRLGGATPGSSTPDPAQFLKLVKGVSKQADENAGMRASGTDPTASNTRVRQGVKQRTMGMRRERPASSSVAGTGLVKGKEREHGRPPLSRSSSATSSASPSSFASVSSPDSDYSFVSADTSMTSPEPDNHLGGLRRGAQELMPPPPVPQGRLPGPGPIPNRLPALDVFAPRPGASKQSLPPPPPASASFSANAHPISPTASRAAPETRIHPLLQERQKPKSAPAPVRSANLAPSASTSTSTPTHAPAPAPAAPTPTPAVALPPARTTLPPPQHSQSQPQRRGPPVLGMRRTNTAPLANRASGGSGSAPLASQGPKKFRPPLLNPAPPAGGVQVKTEPGVVPPAQMQMQHRPYMQATVKTEVKREYPPPPPPAHRPAPPPAQLQAPTTPAQSRRTAAAGAGYSSPSDDTSFDMDELERVMKEYD